jgi:hypothetical protein
LVGLVRLVVFVQPVRLVGLISGLGRKAQGAKVCNVLSEFRVSGTIERA